MINDTKIDDLIENLIEYAWNQAIKYRFDPVVGKIHAEYLEMVKQTKIEINEKNKGRKTTFFNQIRENPTLNL